MAPTNALCPQNVPVKNVSTHIDPQFKIDFEYINYVLIIK